MGRSKAYFWAQRKATSGFVVAALAKGMFVPWKGRPQGSGEGSAGSSFKAASRRRFRSATMSRMRSTAPWHASTTVRSEVKVAIHGAG
jgi:hypothetical protein